MINERVVKFRSDVWLAEEAPLVYKDIDNVVRVVEHAKLVCIVSRVKTLRLLKLINKDKKRPCL